MAGMGIGEMMLLNAAIGGGASALQGRDPLQGALMGGLTGAAGAGLGSLLGAGATAAGQAGAQAAGQTAGQVAGQAAGQTANIGQALSQAGAITQGGSGGLYNLITNPAVSAAPVGAATAFPVAGVASEGLTASTIGALPEQVAPNLAAGPMGSPLTSATAPNLMATAEPSMFSKFSNFMEDPKSWWKSLSPEQRTMWKLGGGIGALALMSQRPKVPGQQPYTGSLSRFSYNPDTFVPTLPYAQGGITSLGPDMAVGGDFDWQQRSEPVTRMASGGMSNLGGYSDGGRLLKGPGDGMSDNIPAMIGRKQPARLADGEFVVPADVVSHLGNGSTDAGAKQLYSMMDRVRSARTGNKKQGRQIKPHKFMPA